MVHPATGETVPGPFRMSAIAPMNIPLVYLMVTATGMPAQLFLQWLNQTYNSACNYFNRGGETVAWKSLAEAYGLAVAASCSLAYGFGQVCAKIVAAFDPATPTLPLSYSCLFATLQLVKKGPPVFRRAGVLIPLVSVAAANVSNVVLTRKNEVTDGVPVTDSNGDVVGISKKAGINAVAQTAISRGALVPMAVLLLPPVVMGGLKRIKMMPTNPRAKLVAEVRG